MKMKRYILILVTIGILAGVSAIAESISKSGKNNVEPPLENAIEGIVLNIDVTPMHVDGPGEVYVLSDNGKKIIFYISVCSGPCSTEANKIIFKLQKGDHIKAKGSPITNEKFSIYDDENHFIRLISEEE